MARLPPRWAVITAFTGVFGLAGCNRSDSPATYPVAGAVRVNGQPAASALVTFHPLDGQAAKPSGRVGEYGTFALTTREGGDGAPAGEYRVTVVWTRAVAGKKGASEADDVPVRSLLPASYANPESTPLRATVKPGANEPIVFEIKTAGR